MHYPNYRFERDCPKAGFATFRPAPQAARWASKMRALIYFTIALTISAHLGVARAQGTDEVATPNAATDSGVGFKTVAEALETLKNTPGVNITYTKPDNWVIITEPGGKAIWSFTPQQHYAYPAVVKRELRVRPDGGVYIEMRALCQADKSACDKLIEEFKQLNNRSHEGVQQKLNQGSGQ